MTDLDRFHTDHQADAWAISVWNGAGIVIACDSAEQCEELLELYEPMRLAHSFPWVHTKPAVRGSQVIGLLQEGLYPWHVPILPEGGIGTVKAVPLHRIQLQLVVARYTTGKPRLLEVWAGSVLHAEIYAMDMLKMHTAMGDVASEVDFENTEVIEAVKRRQEESRIQRSTPPVLPEIPGFGKIADITKL